MLFCLLIAAVFGEKNELAYAIRDWVFEVYNTYHPGIIETDDDDMPEANMIEASTAIVLLSCTANEMFKNLQNSAGLNLQNTDKVLAKHCTKKALSIRRTPLDLEARLRIYAMFNTYDTCGCKMLVEKMSSRNSDIDVEKCFEDIKYRTNSALSSLTAPAIWQEHLDHSFWLIGILYRRSGENPPHRITITLLTFVDYDLQGKECRESIYPRKLALLKRWNIQFILAMTDDVCAIAVKTWIGRKIHPYGERLSRNLIMEKCTSTIQVIVDRIEDRAAEGRYDVKSIF